MTPLKLALHGMDARTCKTMALFLKGPCKGVAIISEFDAEIDVIDADYIKAKEILDERKASFSPRVIILLSLEELAIEGMLFVKKPIKTVDLVTVLTQAKIIVNKRQPKKNESALDKIPNSKPELVTEGREKIKESAVGEEQSAKRLDNDEIKKTSKPRTAMDLTEGSFSVYMGYVAGVDFSDSQQALNASYSPQGYFLRYVQSAVNESKKKGQAIQLNVGWKPLIVFPQRQEIFLDVDDKQLRSFAGLIIRNVPPDSILLSPVEQTIINHKPKMENVYDVDYFLWRLAIWTSKGRYPETIDINRPVYLMQWPNFTRLLVTPHALRIAALLVLEPRTATSIADTLKLKLEYVFVFISAAHAIGLLGQAQRQVDLFIEPAEVKVSKSKGLLSRILSRLRG